MTLEPVESDFSLYSSSTGYPVDYSGPSLESVINNLIDLCGYDDPVYWVWGSSVSVGEKSSYYVCVADFADGTYIKHASNFYALAFNSSRVFQLRFTYSTSSSPRSRYEVSYLSPSSYTFAIAPLGGSFNFTPAFADYGVIGFYPVNLKSSYRFGSFISGVSGISLLYGNVGIAVPSSDVLDWYFYRISDGKPDVLCGVPLSDCYDSSGGLDYAEVACFIMCIAGCVYLLHACFGQLTRRRNWFAHFA